MTIPIQSQITFLATSDLEATADFYERILGLELALDQGRCRIYSVCGNAFIGFCEREQVSAPDEGVILTLVAEDVDGWYQALIAKGIEIEKPPVYNPDFRIYHCFLRDPSGYLIEIQRFEDARWGRSGSR